MFCYLYRFHNCLLKGNTLVVKRNWHFYRNLENWKGFWKLLEYLIQQSAIDNRYLNEKKIFTMNHANTKCYNVFEQSIRPLPWIWYENVCTYMNVLCNDILLYKTVLIMSCFMLLKKIKYIQETQTLDEKHWEKRITGWKSQSIPWYIKIWSQFF